MNTNSEVERIVGTWLEDRVVDPPHGSLASALARTGDVAQQRHWWQRWWLGRRGRAAGTGGDREGRGGAAPDDDRRSHLKFSALTVGVAAIAITLMVMLLFPQGTIEPEPPTMAGTTYSVAADGSADYATIAAAVAVAVDGDTVLVEPGHYEEAFTISADITLAGSGDAPREVVISIPADAPPPIEAIAPLHSKVHGFEMSPFPSVGLQLLETEATLRNLQVFGRDEGVAVLVRGGAPLFDDVVIKHVGQLDTDVVLAGGLFIDAGSKATVRGGQTWHRIQIDGGSSITFTDAARLENAKVTVQGGSDLAIEDSTVVGCYVQAIAIVDGSTAVIERNSFTDGGIDVRGGIEGAVSATITDNTFMSIVGAAIYVADDATAIVAGNDLVENQYGISVSHAEATITDNDLVANFRGIALTGSDATVEGNTIKGGDGIGVVTVIGGAPRIADNTIIDAGKRGISVGAGTAPIIDGNSVCGNEVNLMVDPMAEPVIGDNDICPDEAGADD